MYDLRFQRRNLRVKIPLNFEIRIRYVVQSIELIEEVDLITMVFDREWVIHLECDLSRNKCVKCVVCMLTECDDSWVPKEWMLKKGAEVNKLQKSYITPKHTMARTKSEKKNNKCCGECDMNLLKI